MIKELEVYSVGYAMVLINVVFVAVAVFITFNYICQSVKAYI